MGLYFIAASIYMKKDLGGKIMKRIGTLTSAAGLIFLGVWMIISRNNAELGDQIFNWWPALIILLGVEILVIFSVRKEEQRVGMNYFLIPVIILFLLVNIYHGIVSGIKLHLGNNISLGDLIKYADSNINDWESRYKKIETTKTIEKYGTGIIFSSENANVNIKKSTDGKIRIDTKVYVERSSKQESYTISEVREADGLSIRMNEDFIRRVSTDIYVPEGYNVTINSENLNFTSKEALPQSNFNLKAGSCNVEIKGGASAVLDFNNGNINIDDVKTVNIKGDNSNVNLGGNVESIDVSVDSGKIDVRNNNCKNAAITADSGAITFRTHEKNAGVELVIDSGICVLNNSRMINSGISQKFGTGENKIKIKTDSGAISFINQE